MRLRLQSLIATIRTLLNHHIGSDYTNELVGGYTRLLAPLILNRTGSTFPALLARLPVFGLLDCRLLLIKKTIKLVKMGLAKQKQYNADGLTMVELTGANVYADDALQMEQAVFHVATLYLRDKVRY